MRVGKNSRDACFNDRIAQLTLEDNPLVVSDEISFDLVAGPFGESLDVVDAKALQTPDSSLLKKKVGSAPLVIPIRIMRDTFLVIRKGILEQRIDPSLRVSLDPCAFGL